MEKLIFLVQFKEHFVCSSEDQAMNLSTGITISRDLLNSIDSVLIAMMFLGFISACSAFYIIKSEQLTNWLHTKILGIHSQKNSCVEEVSLEANGCVH